MRLTFDIARYVVLMSAGLIVWRWRRYWGLPHDERGPFGDYS